MDHADMFGLEGSRDRAHDGRIRSDQQNCLIPKCAGERGRCRTFTRRLAQASSIAPCEIQHLPFSRGEHL